ncbi:MAG: hypothetical protein IKQ17_06000 [Kiritimatiellae bacterium]|nr:hypothetical protein [Kiritimatiellia bacterium]
MKKTIFTGLLVCLSFAVLSAPPFVTPAMMKRNGLTDEQYELLWKQGKNPQIDVATARDWIFRASRYTNVVEWLDVCGKTNDFAKLSHKLQGDNFELTETNKAVKAENVVLVRKNKDLEIDLADADGYRKAVKEIEKAARKDSKNLAKLRKDLEKYRDKAATEAFAELCGLLLELLLEGE